MTIEYSPQSVRARACGDELLDLTRGYEDLLVPAGLGVGPIAVLGIVARARHLLRTAYATADAADALGATLAVRAINESVMTLGWFDKDPELAELVWMLDEIRSRLSHHREVAAEERKQRRRARRRGEAVAAIPSGKSLGLLNRGMVRRLKQTETETKARVAKLRDRPRRLKRLKVKKVNRMPSFAERAEVAGMPWAYLLAYKSDSNAAAHPNPLAIEQFLEARPDGIHIRATPKGQTPDPYYVAARLFAALVEIAGHHLDQSALEPGLEATKAKLDELSAEVAQVGGSGAAP